MPRGNPKGAMYARLDPVTRQELEELEQQRLQAQYYGVDTALLAMQERMIRRMHLTTLGREIASLRYSLHIVNRALARSTATAKRWVRLVTNVLVTNFFKRRRLTT